MSREKNMNYFDRIEKKLREKFSPSSLSIIDESNLHVGHSGARPGGETHFRVKMVSNFFEGMSRIDRQRAVQSASNTQINTQSSEAVLNSRIEVAPDVDANQARNRYQETSGGPTTVPENYTQVALDA